MTSRKKGLITKEPAGGVPQDIEDVRALGRLWRKSSAVQMHFLNGYLGPCLEFWPHYIVRFLEDFRRIHGSTTARSGLISLKVPEHLLAALRAKARLPGLPYQALIMNVMQAGLEET